MIRIVSVLALALASHLVLALDTPMVLAAGNRTIVVSPAFGTMTLFDSTTAGLRPLISSNFLVDLEVLARRPLGVVGDDAFTMLRAGSANNKPTTTDLINLLPRKPSAAELAKNLPSLYEQARLGEKAFWSKPHEYDGKIAIASTGQYLLIAVSSMHALLFYELASDDFKLVGFRNIGGELHVPTIYHSAPNPNQLLAELPPDLLTKAIEQLGGAESTADLAAAPKNGAAPAPDPVAKEVPPTPDCELWTAAANNTFVVVDALTERAMTYQITGRFLELQSVRNLKTDLLIPGILGKGIRSQPENDDLLKEYSRRRKRQLDLFGFEVDLPGMKALVSQAASAGSKAKLQAAMANALLTLDFTDRRTILTFDISNDQLNLVSARDYTVDVGIAILEGKIKQREAAPVILEDAVKSARANDPVTAKEMLRWALSLDPALYKKAEEKSELKKALGKDPEWVAMLEEASKQTEALKKQAEERRKQAEEERKRRAK